MTAPQRSGTETLINYEGRVFRSAATETADAAGAGPIGHYRQEGDIVWAAFAGGKVIRGALVGRCDGDGVLELTYSQLLRTGEVIAGRCTSVPTVLEDGRIRLREHWQRLWPERGTGVSIIEEPPPPLADQAARQTREDG